MTIIYRSIPAIKLIRILLRTAGTLISIANITPKSEERERVDLSKKLSRISP